MSVMQIVTFRHFKDISLRLCNLQDRAEKLTLASLGVLVRVVCVFCRSLHGNLLLLTTILLEKRTGYSRKLYLVINDNVSIKQILLKITKQRQPVFSHCPPQQTKEIICL